MTEVHFKLLSNHIRDIIDWYPDDTNASHRDYGQGRVQGVLDAVGLLCGKAWQKEMSKEFARLTQEGTPST